VSVHVHIERLVLDGLAVAPAERPLLRASLEADLAARLATNGLAAGVPAGGAIARLTTRPIQLSAQPDAGALGRQIADAVHTGLTGG
jgi:hypothetical protein